MDEQITSDVFYRALQNIARSKETTSHKIAAELDLLVHLAKAAVLETGMQFHTLFSIIAYTGHKYNLPGRLVYNIHRFRRQAGRDHVQNQAPDDRAKIYRLGLKILADTIRLIFDQRPPSPLISLLPSDDIYYVPRGSVVQFKKHQRVLVVDKDEKSECLIGLNAEAVDQSVKIKYNLPDRNENFNASIALLGQDIPLPTEINLIDIEIDDQGFYLPKAFILDPDFLIDITAVAEASKEKIAGELVYLTRKFLPVIPNKNLMLGNIANFFLDEIMSDQTLDFRTLIGQVFGLNPIAFSLFDDTTAREIVQRAQKHFVNLKMVVKRSLPKHGIEIEHCFLEPTYYSDRYGIQGRLDVLHDNPNIGDDASIIELKSGKPYRANVYGLSHNHYIQTLLYDLLIKSASDDQLRPTNFILYSGIDTNHLRFAPAVRSQQYEALAVRNQLVATDRKLAAADQFISHPAGFNSFFNQGVSQARGFLLRDIQLLRDRFDKLSIVEQKYFLAMVGFIAREHRLAKIGIEGEKRNNGQASLWLNTLAEKESEFNIISYLVIKENKTTDSDPTIILRKSARSSELANFRKGDLGLLYPVQENKSPLGNQLFKGTILEIDENQLIFRLRAKQFNSQIFEQFDFWNIEHDSLDSSFLGLYRSLYHFMGFDLRARQKYLTIKPPAPAREVKWEIKPEMTAEQNRIIREILAAEDYFLLWGPPGTGKTSIMLRFLVGYLVEKTPEKILLVAYTNRAVDEICRALDKLGPEIQNQSVRIGSRYSTDQDFVEMLLGYKMKDISTRDQLKTLLGSQRIVVGTASSLMGRIELFELMHFDRIIVDEATQMLDPMMAGLLPRFKKVLLIGDHRQLAAVVTQKKSERIINDQTLLSIGVVDLGDSYFERVYRRCEEEGWDWALAKLTHQGRMHREIMTFPRDHFYDGELKILPEEEDTLRQSRPLPLTTDGNKLDNILASRRVSFIPICSEELFRSKTNAAEAKLTGEIIVKLFALYEKSEQLLAPQDIGVITPFRAQIAKIREELASRDLDPNQFSIDTVERFQGGARKIIIISLCINAEQQLESLVSVSSDGIDRKLNVALTRAREQLIVMGNPEILNRNPIYRAYINTYRVEI